MCFERRIDAILCWSWQIFSAAIATVTLFAWFEGVSFPEWSFFSILISNLLYDVQFCTWFQLALHWNNMRQCDSIRHIMSSMQFSFEIETSSVFRVNAEVENLSTFSINLIGEMFEQKWQFRIFVIIEICFLHCSRDNLVKVPTFFLTLSLCYSLNIWKHSFAQFA